MPITPDLEAQILRYYHAEHWPVGTIAHQLGLHRDSVDRVLTQAGLPRVVSIRRPSAIDPYLPFILETLETFPRLKASRLYAMVKDRGYPGRPDHFRHLIARHRPRPKREAYLRLRTLPGEQAQIDWGHFGEIRIGRARHTLMAFVAVLSYSRRIFLRFYLGAQMENFLRGHVAAFSAWEGVARVLLYDNLKSAVLERQGEAIRFHPTLLALAGHYRFEPRPVAPARGNEKGRVERAIRYVRDAFFAGRTIRDLDTLNAEAEAWTAGAASERRCPEDPDRTVAEVFAEERLLALPADVFPTDEVRAVRAGKTPYVRFDRNDYSIPHDCVAQTLTVSASLDAVRILDGQTVIATHRRRFDRGAQVEDAAHLADLIEAKRAARAHRGTDRLVAAIPACRDFLAQAAERGEPLGRIVRQLNDWLDHYGVAKLTAAVEAALTRGVPHPNAVRRALDRQAPPAVAVALPEHVKRRDVPVRPHALADYDALLENDDE